MARWIAALLLLIGSTAGIAQEPIDTRFGTVSIDNAGGVLFEGQPVESIDGGASRPGDSVVHRATYERGAEDWVLLSTDGYSRLCHMLFRFVRVSDAGAAATADFGTCAEKYEIEEDRLGVHISAPGFMGMFEPEAAQEAAALERYRFSFDGTRLIETQLSPAATPDASAEAEPEITTPDADLPGQAPLQLPAVPENLQRLLILIGSLLLLFVIVKGLMKDVVVFYDFKDALISFLAVALVPIGLVAGTIIDPAPEGESEMGAMGWLIAAAAVLTALFCAWKSAAGAFAHNRFWLAVLIAPSKLALSIILPLSIFASLRGATDRKSTRGEAVLFLILAAVLGWLWTALVNGSEVYMRRSGERGRPAGPKFRLSKVLSRKDVDQTIELIPGDDHVLNPDHFLDGLRRARRNGDVFIAEFANGDTYEINAYFANKVLTQFSAERIRRNSRIRSDMVGLMADALNGETEETRTRQAA